MTQLRLARRRPSRTDAGKTVDTVFDRLQALAFVEIQLAMQQNYGFTIPDEDAQSITNVGQAIEYTNRRIQETRS